MRENICQRPLGDYREDGHGQEYLPNATVEHYKNFNLESGQVRQLWLPLGLGQS